VNRGKILLRRLLGRLLDQLRKDDRGVILVFALVLMLVLTIMGAAMSMTSQVDLTVSGNTKMIREAFYIAEGGIELSPKVLAMIIAKRSLPDTTAETPLLAYDTVNLLAKIMGYIQTDDPNNNPPDVVMSHGLGGSVAVDFRRVRTLYLSGGGVEFAAGSEGVGVSGASSAAILYEFDSTGTAGKSRALTNSEVIARYRKVAGVGGGK
jgi:Tfp pilus assembly protein PilX